MRTFTLTICACFLTLSLGWSPLIRADAVTDWNANAGKAAIAACISPAADALHESRMYAMMNIAIHNAVSAINRRFQPYILDIPDARLRFGHLSGLLLENGLGFRL
jgi:hypothetical protein